MYITNNITESDTATVTTTTTGGTGFTPASLKHCGRCGSKLKRKWSFCPSCGYHKGAFVSPYIVPSYPFVWGDCPAYTIYDKYGGTGRPARRWPTPQKRSYIRC